MKFLNVNFQRNGVSGEPFYSVNYKTKEGNFLATFETVGDTNIVNRATCRVVNLNDLQSCWRGDEIADQLTAAFKEAIINKGMESIYDLTPRGQQILKQQLTASPGFKGQTI